MSLHRFYLPPEQWAHDLWLEGQEAKHLVQVLRLAPGEEVLLLDGQGRSGRFAIAETAKKKARLVLQEEQMAPAPESRAVMALVGGFGLGAAGFVYQTVFRNPLASPDIIGVSSGASVGAAFAILFVSSGALSTTVCAFAGGLAAVFLSLGLAAAAPGRSKMSLVLAGIAVHALAQTLLMLLKLTADPEKELASIEYWIMGSLAAVTRSRVWFPVPVVLVCCAAIFALHRQALLLSIEEGEARLLGVRVGAMRLLLLTLATMTVAAVVSVTGLISFVGLLAPHSARLLAGHNRRSACLLSGLLGSALLLAADTLAKTAASTELPVSIFTSLLGVPFLLYLILRPGRDAS